MRRGRIHEPLACANHYVEWKSRHRFSAYVIYDSLKSKRNSLELVKTGIHSRYHSYCNSFQIPQQF